jgi:hypothetical protein
MELSSQEKIDLKRLVNESDCENNTELIRELKHSHKILADICVLEKLKKTKKQTMTEDEYSMVAQTEASFLYTCYPDIYRRLMKDELDLIIMSRLLRVLKMIEDGELDQHEGSAVMGKVLKELYVDSAVRHGENLDKQYENDKPPKEEGKSLSWKEWKVGRE